MTHNSKWYGAAQEYVQYKEMLAQELRLNLFASSISGSKMTLVDKIPRQMLPLTKTLCLKMKFYRGDNRRCDLDNLVKMVMDLLQTAQVIYNDDQVREIHAQLFKNEPKPYFIIELT